jgi:hypothetical protein
LVRNSPSARRVGGFRVRQLAAVRRREGPDFLDAMELYGFKAVDVDRQRSQPGRVKTVLELHIDRSVVLCGRVLQTGGVTPSAAPARSCLNWNDGQPHQDHTPSIPSANHPWPRSSQRHSGLGAVQHRSRGYQDPFPKWACVDRGCGRLPTLAAWPWRSARCPQVSLWRCLQPSRTCWSASALGEASPVCASQVALCMTPKSWRRSGAPADLHPELRRLQPLPGAMLRANASLTRREPAIGRCRRLGRGDFPLNTTVYATLSEPSASPYGS